MRVLALFCILFFSQIAFANDTVDCQQPDGLMAIESTSVKDIEKSKLAILKSTKPNLHEQLIIASNVTGFTPEELLYGLFGQFEMNPVEEDDVSIEIQSLKDLVIRKIHKETILAEWNVDINDYLAMY